jgi:DNA-binding response OmpR family regulator
LLKTAHLAPSAHPIAPPFSARALLVDPDPAADTAGAVHLLRANGFTVEHLAGAQEAQAAAGAGGYDLILIETAAAGYDGVELCRRLVQSGRAAVIIWSQQASALDQVAGLELGADDFVSKSAHPLELLARSRAVLRRGLRQTQGRPAETLAPDTWLFSPGTNGLQAWTGAQVWLRRGCSLVLEALCETPRRPVSRDEVAARLARGEREYLLRGVDVLVSRLRRAFEECEGGGRLVRTALGKGYFLSADAQPRDQGFLIHGDPPGPRG